MESDYEILWTDLALEELGEAVDYLKREFTEKEVDNLGDEIERITAIVSYNPKIYPLSDKLKTRKVVILKFNTMYYRILNMTVEIISFYSNRKSPENRKI